MFDLNLDLVDFDVATSPGRNRNASWAKTAPRLLEECWPEINPSFTMPAGAKIFTIGSCFARNIEEHIHRLGFRVPMLDFSVPTSEWHARPNGILNKYTPASIYQEVKWAAGILKRDRTVREEDCDALFYRLDSGQVIDNNLAGFTPVSYERALERRASIYKVFENVFDSDCTVITPGVTEAWYDTERRIFIEHPPIGRGPIAKFQQSAKLVLLDFAACLHLLQETLDIIRSVNPKAKFLLTTSPVPLIRTFTTQDILVANTYSKSVLRAACGELCTKNAGADYFPSYETVMLTRSWDIFEADRVHPTDAIIAKIVGRLTASYFSAAGQVAQMYQASFAEEDPGKALAMATRAAELAPTNAEYRLQMGALLLKLKRSREAQQVLRKAIEIAPALIDAHRLLAQAYEHQGNLVEAVASMEAAIALSPANAFLREGAGRLLIKMKRWEQAERALRAALEIRPSLVSAYSRLATVLTATSRRDEALGALREALQLRPQSAEIQGQIGELLMGAKG